MDRNVQLQNLRDLAEVWISILVVNIPRNQRSKDVSPSWSESAEPRRSQTILLTHNAHLCPNPARSVAFGLKLAPIFGSDDTDVRKYVHVSIGFFLFYTQFYKYLNFPPSNIYLVHRACVCVLNTSKHHTTQKTNEKCGNID
ncbi:hypothetical protein Y032_0145g2474 [Ancylostoma ceylanicum]|uniref:Uncharacterized protein n=1 Tax=Ancylostoma ceylanicum TaxID=53326 RepID=A0A016T2I6_9BILA|nr:hypothetical protein Y032_0145g2474 [Ancylostoma ceylanicum]